MQLRLNFVQFLQFLHRFFSMKTASLCYRETTSKKGFFREIMDISNNWYHCESDMPLFKGTANVFSSITAVSLTALGFKE